MRRTVIQVLDDTAKRFPARPAFKEKKGGTWRTTSWGEYRAQVRTAAKALIALGVEPKTGVSIIGYNSCGWVVADMAAILAGAMPAGIYTTSSPEQCLYVAHHSESAVVFTENTEQTKKFLEVKDRMPHLKRIVQWSGPVAGGELVMTWDAMMALGEKEDDARLEARIAAQSPDDVCTLIYTSGTTGEPKAVMLSHDNLVFTGEVLAKALGFDEDTVSLSYLPLSHIAEQMATIHGPLQAGGVVYFAESLEKLGENLREVRPTAFVGVPRVWEKMQAKMVAAGAAAPPLRRKIAAWARKIGLQGGYADQNGQPRPLLYPLADKLVFSKVRERLGLDRARICITSAAPISKDTLEFFLSLGITLCEIYGMSECTGPTTLSVPSKYKTGKAGYAMPGAEVKIAEDGEVCMRGRHVFKGYFKNEEATREALDSDGWLHSGDVGEIDPDGFLRITDRKKELIITAGGENIAPQMIEGLLKSIPVVAQAVVIGDRMKYLVALLTLDPERIEEEAKAAGSPARDLASAAKCPKMKAHLEKQVAKLNQGLARVQTIKKIAILPNELTIDGGELTPTMKLKRKVINEKYADVIAGLYADDEHAGAAATA
jgi:long-subunit acyl-CoA synthetase (AMP-forming)